MKYFTFIPRRPNIFSKGVYKMIHIVTEQIEDVMFSGMKPVLEMRLQYPKISGRLPMKTETAFNDYYLRGAQNINRYVRTEFFARAENEFRRFSRESFPFSMHTFTRTASVRAVSERFCALTFDTFRYGGGTRGTVTRNADIWSVARGVRMDPTEFFARGFDIKHAFLPYVFEQLRSNDPECRLNDSERTAAQLFSTSNICLTSEGFEVFYPVYTLAPYDCGISAFTIPFSAPGIKYAQGFDPAQLVFQS